MDIYFTYDKLRVRIADLVQYRFRDPQPAVFLGKADCPSEPVAPALPGPDTVWEPVRTGDTWSGRDTYLWLKCVCAVPETVEYGVPVGVFDFGKTASCNCGGFESLLYVDGVPYKGVDTHHGEVYFPVYWAGQQKELVFRLWAGLEGGGKPAVQTHVFSRACTAVLDTDTDYLYYTGKMVHETIPLLDGNDPVKTGLLRLLDRVMNLVDRREPGSASFYASVSKAAELLREELPRTGAKLPVNVIALGNTHIDVAWLWRYKHTREKAARSFSTVLRLMEQYPEYTFLMSQPQVYEYVKKDFPELYEQIRERIKEGRWEIEGGMWLEADCNIPSGESLTRQFLMGSVFAKKEFGKTMKCLWLPDVFGYSWALPQILRKSGIETFVTTKISWNECNQMPNDTFIWRGIDGTDVLTHFITTPAAAEEQGSWYYTYNGEMLPASVKGIWNNYRNKDLTNTLLLAYGYGDGGGGVNREELEQRRCLDAIPGLPSVKTGTAKDFFEGLHAAVESGKDRLPVWDGELYLENHRGTYTSHAYNKYMNRYLEFRYRDAEWLGVLRGLKENVLQTNEDTGLNEGWKTILRNQFHDVIPGSAIREVYEDSRQEYAEADALAEQLNRTALQILRTGEQGFSVINSGLWDWEGLVEVPLAVGETLRTAEGALCPVQQENGRTRVLCSVPAMSIQSCSVADLPGELVAEQKSPFLFDIDGRTLETPFYTAVFDPCGRLASLYDKQYGRSVIAEGTPANRLVFFEDEPVVCDAWNINLYYTQKRYEVDDLVSMSVSENGPLEFVLHCAWNYGKSALAQDICFYARDRRIDFVTSADIHERHQLLKVEFPVKIRSTFATYDIQYGNVRRANNWNTSWDQAKFETVMHKWVDLSDSDYGVSLLNDCKYGCDVKDNMMRLTLIKTATYPDCEQDQGEHYFTYSLLPHAGDVLHSDTEKEAFYLNDPMKCVSGTVDVARFLSVDNDGVALDAVKVSEDGETVVVRLHEFRGSEKVCRLSPGFRCSAYAEASLMEVPVGEFRTVEGALTLRFTPYEIKTLLFKTGS